MITVDAKSALATLDRLIDGLEAAVLRGMQDVADAGADEAWSRSKGSVRASVKTRVVGDSVEVRAEAPHAHFVEHGRGPVYAKPGKVLRFEIAGKVFFRRSVGPAAAKPFMRPASVVMNSSNLVEASIQSLIRGS